MQYHLLADQVSLSMNLSAEQVKRNNALLILCDQLLEAQDPFPADG
jgi:hypothetical protein